ncbi:hypothetical protein BDR22DRAFT_781596, partial [Usnea florida]
STDTSPAPKPRRASMPVYESERRPATDTPIPSRTSLAYPKFSKEHSKEAVGSRENVVNPRTSYYTPDPTDLDRGKGLGAEVRLKENANLPPPHRAPPSPPETTVDQKVPIEKAKVDTVKKERKGTELQKHADDLKRRLGRTDSSASDREKERPLNSSRSRTSVRERESGKEEDKFTKSAKSSKPSTPSKLKPKVATVEDSASATSLRRSASSTQSSIVKSETSKGSTIDSDATSVAPNQEKAQRSTTPVANRDLSPATDPDSSPGTPTNAEPRVPPSRKETPAISTLNDYGVVSTLGDSPMPPPPPPALDLPMPRVDYLMQNGGLPQSVPRSLLGGGLPTQTPLPAPAVAAQAEKFFGPLSKILDDYTKVMSRNGSLAVATGYRSVARRLLDRLEAVFARDISSESCTCMLCQTSHLSEAELDDERGVSWGEILEYVCGRQELPQWPNFVMDSTQDGLGISTPENVPPMQKLDVDVPEEFRDHYIRQSKKTKMTVDKWLDSQPQQPSSPPQDVDDETLTFAMLTRLEPEQRPIFSSLAGVQPSRPASTAPSAATAPSNGPESELLQKTGLAIQRLYRLSKLPRDPESAMYLLNNPSLHNVLATLAAISDPEWDILTSGRFDGFLRSGADDHPITTAPAPPPSRGGSRASQLAPRMTTPSMPLSRGPTPFSRGQTPAPATAGAPVALDEETEIAVLAEVEREIFLSMDYLEHSFEALHYKAEAVRQALRERGAGLAQANQRRRGIFDMDSMMGTPASHLGDHKAWESETDDGFDDGMSEIAPDDSASNVSSSRRRRHKRRTERRTPAPVEEEDEEEE